jgi:hypothetical protein
MNTALHPTTIQGHRFVSWALVAGMVLFSLNSYPMMYKGYDVWYHLEGIRNPGMHINVFWHQAWHQIINLFEINENEFIYINSTKTGLSMETRVAEMEKMIWELNNYRKELEQELCIHNNKYSFCK